MSEIIRKQLAEQLNAKEEWITGVEVGKHGIVYFTFGASYTAKVSKNGKKVLKNSVRLNSW